MKKRTRRKIIKGMITALKLAIVAVLCFIAIIWAILFNAEQMDARYADMNRTQYAQRSK